MTTQEELLQQILDELRRQSQQIVLGFTHPPKARYIYANRQYSDALWYFWNGARNEHEPIEYHAITCIIDKLEIEAKEFRGKPDPKVNLHIKADRPYVIQAGFDTLFAKGLLYALYKMESVSGVITIAVEPGETEQVLFCRIYQGNQSVYAPWPDDADWNDVAQAVIAKFEGKPEPKPIPKHLGIEADPLTGQTELLPSDGAIADTLTTLIKKMGAQEVEIIAQKLEHWRSQLGETAYSVLYQKWQSRAKQLNPESIDRANVIALISIEMDHLDWTKDQGREHLQQTYQKNKRADLTDKQLVEFLAHLKRLRSQGSDF